MKNILILTSNIKRIQKIGFTSTLCAFSDIAIFLDNTNHGVDSIKIMAGARNIAEFDTVYFRPWRKNKSIAVPVAMYLLSKKIRFIDPEVGYSNIDTKAFEYMKFCIAKLPIPKTIIASVKKIRTIYATSQRFIQYPLILKSPDGSKGSDNYLIHTYLELKKILSTYPNEMQFIVQEYIPNTFDYRFLVTGYKTACVYKRIRNPKSNSHLNNVSKGGTREDVDPKSIKSICNIAEKASKLLHREVCGVDIMIADNTKKPYILEANSAPQLDYLPTFLAVKKYLGES